MGRKSKLNEETQNLIIEVLEEGHTYKTACECAGIVEATFYDWLDKGEKQKTGQYAEFLEAVKRAGSEAKRLLLQQIRTASKRQWQAAAWILERRFPDEFGAKIHQEHEGTIKLLIERASDKQPGN